MCGRTEVFASPALDASNVGNVNCYGSCAMPEFFVSERKNIQDTISHFMLEEC